MGALEQIGEMKNQGISENEIISKLQQQGVSPKEISDALNQSQIKQAVGNPPQENQREEMETSVMDQGPPQSISNQPLQQQAPTETSQNNYPQKKGQTPTENYNYQNEFPPQEEYYPPEAPQESYPGNYEGYDEYGGGSGANTDTLMEIAEQVFTEKIKKTQKKVEELNELKSIAKIKLDNLAERVKRMEKIIDKLQLEILNKVGSYGGDLSSIKKEMSMMQDSFGKMVSGHTNIHPPTTKHQVPHKQTPQIHHKVSHKPTKKTTIKKTPTVKRKTVSKKK